MWATALVMEWAGLTWALGLARALGRWWRRARRRAPRSQRSNHPGRRLCKLRRSGRCEIQFQLYRANHKAQRTKVESVVVLLAVVLLAVGLLAVGLLLTAPSAGRLEVALGAPRSLCFRQS